VGGRALIAGLVSLLGLARQPGISVSHHIDGRVACRGG
jgi:hypothetical protein